MMNIALVTILLLICNAYGQSKQINVDYQVFNDTDMPNTLYATLKVCDSVSIYQEKYSTAKSWKIKESAQNSEVVMATNAFEPYYKINIRNKKLLYYNMIMSNTFLIEDNYSLSWVMTNETKLISGFSCKKATTKFRGRVWTAWFAPEIPISFGPWKLYGLPGLILEAYDDEKKYTFKAIKITQSENKISSVNFRKLMVSKNKSPIPLRQFIESQQEAILNSYKKRSAGSNHYTTTIVDIPRTGPEIKYEWE